jgi:antitoxin component of MazEF toxin-antitoxin module
MTDYTKKIIATTDKSLETIEHEKYPNGNSKGIRVDRKVYNLPMQFINEYIKEYNLVCVRQLNLDKVSVELDDDNNIKVDNDNNISVRPCLRFWTLDEVTQLCNAAFFHKDLNRGLPYDYSDTGFIRWVNENI